MTITLNKKNIIIASAAILVIIICIFAYKRYNISQYENAAAEMKINTSVNVALLGEILYDINSAWNTGIEGGTIKDAEGESVYVSDMSKAVQIRIAYWEVHGYYDIIDSLAKETSHEMETMSNTPSKYEDTQKTFTEIYKSTNELISLSKTPQYNLMSFSEKINDLLMNVNSKMKETDLFIKVSDDEIQKKSLTIYTAIINKEKQRIQFKEKTEENRWAFYIKKQKEFLVQNAQKTGVITLPNGLQYKIIKKGTGKIPTDISTIKCHYIGCTIDGYVFDSSYKRRQPITLRANEVIKGLTKVLTRMPQGSIWEVYIPANLAYGNKEQGSIKPYSTLIFKIELIKVY